MTKVLCDAGTSKKKDSFVAEKLQRTSKQRERVLLVDTNGGIEEPN